jgi:hypothetical protein
MIFPPSTCVDSDQIEMHNDYLIPKIDPLPPPFAMFYHFVQAAKQSAKRFNPA